MTSNSSSKKKPNDGERRRYWMSHGVWLDYEYTKEHRSDGYPTVTVWDAETKKVVAYAMHTSESEQRATEAEFEEDFFSTNFVPELGDNRDQS